MKIEDFEHLVTKGWVELPDFFAAALADKLFHYANEQLEKGVFQNARIRNSGAQTLNQNIRKDSIHWVENWNENEATKELGSILKSAGKFLAQELRLGLKSFEGHFSHYRPGDFYLKHIDQHLNTKHRQLSFVTYLNEGVGGELVIYNQNDRNQVEQTIIPKKGKAVIFLSAIIFHEVLPSQFDRLSFTGWFRDDEDIFNDILRINS